MYFRAAALDICALIEVTILVCNCFSSASTIPDRQSKHNMEEERDEINIVEPSLSTNNVDYIVDNLSTIDVAGILPGERGQGRGRGRGKAHQNVTEIQQTIRRNMIRGGGNKMAIYIPKLNYLKKEMCKSEPLQQVGRIQSYRI